MSDLISEAAKQVVEAKVEAKVDSCEDIFVTESDLFDISLKYYKKDNIFFVEGIDDNFDPKEPCKEIKMSLKYPDQDDCNRIALSSSKLDANLDRVDIRDYLKMELARLMVLIRKWSLNKEISTATIINISPKIMKGIFAKVRTVIGTDGIF